MRGGCILILSTLLLAHPAAAQATGATHATQASEGQLINRRDASGAAAADATPAGPSATRVALSLGAVLTLIVLLFLAGRRFLPRGAFAQQSGGGAVQVLSRTTIAPRQRVTLLQVGRRILVIADGGASVSTLCEITDADEVAALLAQLQSERQGGSFTAALSGAMERFRAAQASSSADAEPRPDLDSMRQEIEGLAQRVRGMAR